MSRAAKRLRTIQLIQRIEKQKLDGLGRDLAQVRSDQSEIDHTLADLQTAKARALAADTPVALGYLGGFLKTLDARSQHLLAERDTLSSKEANLSEQIRSAFQAQKTNDVILEQTRQAREQEIARAGQAAEIEAANNVYLRARSARQ